jgi:hypothetical protein
VETRGLDSEFARETYVETDLDQLLAEDIRNGKVSLVILCGNAGDGKTAFLQNLSRNLGLEITHSSKRFWHRTLDNGIEVKANLDGAASFGGRSAKELLDEFFAPFMEGINSDGLVHLVAINDGPLLEWMERTQQEVQQTWLIDQLESILLGETAEVHDRIRFVDLNARSLVGGSQDHEDTLDTRFLNKLLDKMVGSAEVWHECESCSAKDRCHANRSVDTLHDETEGQIARTRLAHALQAVHLRGEVHITAREIRGTLAYIFFGTNDCEDLHKDPGLPKQHYWDRAFDPGSEYRQGDILKELSLLDPGLDSHPRLDRELLKRYQDDHHHEEIDSTPLASLRRRAYFELSEEETIQICRRQGGLDIAGGHHTSRFIQAASGKDLDLICGDLCEGLARLEDLPESARKSGWVPLHITPRTPTETAFWVEKPQSRFSLAPAQLRAVAGLETLPTQLVLTYTFENSHKEHLTMGLELFSLLLDLKDGVQLTDSRSDEVFSNLTIFKQRLVHEDDRTLFAWNPRDERTLKISIEMQDEIQKLTATAI